MESVGKARRVRIYVNEDDRVGHRAAHLAILEFLRREGTRGATVFRGVEGFGASGELHLSHLVDVAQKLPLVVEWIDRPEVVERLLGPLKRLLPRGLVTVDQTEILYFEPGPVRALPAALTARDVMTRDPVAVEPETPLREVVERMLGELYRALPVVHHGVPVGIVTNGDLVRRGGLGARVELLRQLETPEQRGVLEELSEGGKVARDVMTTELVSVHEGTTLPELAEVMTRRRLKRLPVVDDRGRLVGVISRLDLLRTAAGGFGDREPRAGGSGLAADAPVSRAMRGEVPTVLPDTPLAELFQTIVSTRLNRAVGVDPERHVIGIVTDEELLGRLAPSLRSGALRALAERLPFGRERTLRERRGRAEVAGDLMSREVATASEETLLGEAAARMLAGGHKVLAVVDRSNRLVGIVDRADLLHGLLPAAGG